MRRPAVGLGLLLVGIFFSYVLVFSDLNDKREILTESLARQVKLVKVVGASDLALSTEARYTRHLTVSDAVVISMDHPGAIDHFPSSAFFFPGEKL